MSAHDAFYHASVANFAYKHHNTLAYLFNADPDQVTKGDIVRLLDHTIGEQMRAYFERKGRFDTDIIQELKLIPPPQRSIQHVAKSITREEIGMAMNKPIHKALMIAPEYGPSLHRLVQEWRTNRMRKELKQLSVCATDIDRHTRRLLGAIDNFRDTPNFANRLRVKAAMNAVNKSLIRAHHRARIGAVWALRAGFSTDAVTRAINRLYIRRMKNLTSGMAKLDQWIGKNGLQSHIAESIQRRQRILTRELFVASITPELNTQKVRYPKKINALEDVLSYG